MRAGFDTDCGGFPDRPCGLVAGGLRLTAPCRVLARVSIHTAAITTAVLLLTACSPPPPIVSPQREGRPQRSARRSAKIGTKLDSGVRATWRWPLTYLACLSIVPLSACGGQPPIVSADTSCERFAHISATDAQIKVYQDNWEVMESQADQIVANNIEYDKSCLGPVKP